jgi:hypothetical protein
MKYVLIAYLTAAFCVVATADEVKLNNGRTVVGIARHEEPNRVVVESRFGDLRFPADEVQAIQPGRTDIHEYKERFDAIQGGCPSAADVFTLAQWAQERGLVRYVHPLLTQTLELDPEHAEARRLLGYVQFEGNWMLKSQRDSIVAFRQSEHRTVATKQKTVPVRRTTPKVEETPYSLGLPMLPNRSTTDVYPPRSPYNSGHGSYGGDYVMSIGGVTPGGAVVLTYPIIRGTTGTGVQTSATTGTGIYRR